VGGIRFGMARLMIRAGGRSRLRAGVLAVRSLGCLFALLVAVLALAPSSAVAESVCTDTWTGPAEGEWATAGDWSTGKAPTSTTVACIGSGKTVSVTSGANQTGVAQGAGALVISGGSLEVSSALEASSIGSMKLSGGSLSGAGTVDVSGSFSWTEAGVMSGSGRTVIQAGASATLDASGVMSLVARSFVNEGVLTFPEGQVAMSEGAKIENSGTFKASSQTADGQFGNHLPAIRFEPESGAAPLFVNTGVFEKTEGIQETKVGVKFENRGAVQVLSGELQFAGGGSGMSGSWSASTGASFVFDGGSFSLTEGSFAGPGAVKVAGGTVTTENVATSGGLTMELSLGTLTVAKGAVALSALSVTGGYMYVSETSAVSSVAALSLSGGAITDAGTLDVTSSFLWSGVSTLAGGSTVLSPGTSSTLDSIFMAMLAATLVNQGALTFPEGQIAISEGAKIENSGVFKANSQTADGQFGNHLPAIRFEPESGAAPTFVNTGVFEKTEGAEETKIGVRFENFGSVVQETGRLVFTQPVVAEQGTQLGSENPSAPTHPQAKCGDPVSCATGNFSETQTDLAVGGRGVGLNLTRTYNSQAGAEGSKDAFGYGWTNSFSDHLVVNKTSKATTLFQANGSTVPFTEGTGGAFTAPAWTQDTLSGTEGTGYTLTLASQVKYKFAGAGGRLESVTDRDGNATTLTYNEAGQLTTITDPTTRKIKLVYNGEGLIESAEDPMKHVVKYTYEGGNLKSVTQPAEAGLRWQFKYDGSHQLTELTDGRAGKTVNEYNGFHQVTLQKDPAGRELSFEYEVFRTKITNKTTGSVTDEHFTSSDEPVSITHGFGTTTATSESFTYNEGGYITGVTDGDGHTTTYGYSAANDRTSMVDANKNETKWTYDSTHDVATTTSPKDETTTIKREAHGNPETIERPAPESKTQTTKYKYKTTGELESVEDPLKRVSKYEYDTHGNRTAEIDPLTDKRTWEYNEDSQEIATVSPRGNITGGKPAEFTTKTERDSQGRPLKITDPLAHTTKYTYDGDGNVQTVIDGNSHTTKYTYNGDNQPIKVEAPNKSITETEYDGGGQVVSQTDGNKNITKYKRNPVEEVTEVTDSLGRVTKKEYDAAGNLTKLEDPAKRTTTYKSDPANRLTEVSYSSGKPATVTYEYDKDGDRTKMTDGTGTTKYTYDQLDRLTESENGHKEVSKYTYDLANEQTKITYPNTKSVTRAFDTAGRLEKVTDWSANITKFTYNEDSQPATTLFPSATTDEDKYAYNHADQMTEAKMLKGAETLASLIYTRDNDGQLKKTTSKGLPGAEITENTYDENNRLTKSGSEYKYDAANNATTIGTGTYKYNKADQLETGPSLTYTYDELGERTKTKPTTGPATTYGYDQAGDLTSVERPKEGEVSEIKDTYAYNGEGLRASQTISGTTSFLAWDVTESLPLILSDGTNSYIYGPGGLPVEQVSSGGTVTYLHHDQQGSTRLLTGSTGTVTGKCTYGAYGAPTCEGTTTTPLGYDGQYTSSDTGLVYMRARVYDPATAQFMSVDPLETLTREPYSYATDNPLNYYDPSGLFLGIPGTPTNGEVLGAASQGAETVAQGVTEGAEAVGHYVATHPGQIAEYAAVGACVFGGPVTCAAMTGLAFLANTAANAASSCGFSWGREGLIAGETAIGALPGASLAIPEALGLAAEAPPAVNAYLAGPGAVITTLEPAIDRHVLEGEITE
jgi:RHS repeat-associated protein